MTKSTYTDKAERAVRSILDGTPLFPVNAASYITGIHENTIRRWIRERRIRFYGTRGVYRVRLEDLLPESEQEGGK